MKQGLTPLSPEERRIRRKTSSGGSHTAGLFREFSIDPQDTVFDNPWFSLFQWQYNNSLYLTETFSLVIEYSRDMLIFCFIGFFSASYINFDFTVKHKEFHLNLNFWIGLKHLRFFIIANPAQYILLYVIWLHYLWRN